MPRVMVCGCVLNTPGHYLVAYNVISYDNSQPQNEEEHKIAFSHDQVKPICASPYSHGVGLCLDYYTWFTKLKKTV